MYLLLNCDLNCYNLNLIRHRQLLKRDRIPLVTDEDGLGAEGFDWDSTATTGLSLWLTMEETFNVLD